MNAALPTNSRADRRIGWVWCDLGTLAGVLKAVLCQACLPRINESDFLPRLDCIVAAMVCEDVEPMLAGGGQ